ncbi:MAG: hypothetical protein D6683_04085 [Actinomyces sp.]|nr:MAG: hypothetical protein D6683_04085 [Actinomyces sp.]
MSSSASDDRGLILDADIVRRVARVAWLADDDELRRAHEADLAVWGVAGGLRVSTGWAVAEFAGAWDGAVRRLLAARVRGRDMTTPRRPPDAPVTVDAAALPALTGGMVAYRRVDTGDIP